MDISPDEFRGCPKNPPCAFFFNSRWPPPCNAIFEKTGVCHNSSLLQLEKNIQVSLLMFEDKESSSRSSEMISVLFSIPKIQDGRHIDLLNMLSDLLKNENMR